jgi:lysophospholipase L1-like esterase
LNSRGWHDVEHEIVKPPGVASRVVAIGDSFAVGAVPYRANYLTLLESELADQGPVEVINMGIAAAEPQDYLAILAKEGLQFDPDVVMVGFFIGNDFEAAGRQPYEYSYVATLVNAVIRIWSSRPPEGALPGAGDRSYQDDQPTFDRNRFLEIEVDRSWVYATRSERLDAALATAAAHLRGMRDLSRAAGADFVVVVIPDEAQVDPALFAEIARARHWRRGDFDVRQPNRLLAERLAAEGIPFLDLLPAFEEEGRRERLYKPMDTHWNIAGNRLAASRIAAFVRERRGR